MTSNFSIAKNNAENLTINHVKPTFKTLINIKGIEQIEVLKLCQKIVSSDISFSYFIIGDYLIIDSKNRDQAVKRGLLFCRQYLRKLCNKNFHYEVSVVY